MEDKGSLYFFTGLAGAGKTTIGSLFYKRLRSLKPNVVLFDGDDLRKVLFYDVGYTEQERMNGARKGFRLAKFLTDQGIDVVYCSISMFSEIREWNRSNIPKYKEIYIKATRETLMRRNKKKLYTTGKNVVGVDIPFDEPKKSDIVVLNEGDEKPEAIVDVLLDYFGLT